MAHRTRDAHDPQCTYCPAPSDAEWSDGAEPICCECATRVTLAFAEMWPTSEADAFAGASL